MKKHSNCRQDFQGIPRYPHYQSHLRQTRRLCPDNMGHKRNR
jgi:hypothetical protein